MTDKKILWLRAIYCFFILSVPVLVFLSANQLPEYQILVLIIGLITAVTAGLRSKLLRLPFYIILAIGALVRYFPETPFSFRWFSQFYAQISLELGQLFQGELNYFPAKTAFCLILCLIYLTCLLVIDYDLWPIPFILITVYFMLLTIFRDFDLFEEMIFVVAVLCIYLIFRQLLVPLPSNKKGQFLLLTNSTLLVLLAISATLPSYLPTFNQALEEKSEPIRDYLNQEGLYDKINNYKATGTAKTGFSENDEQLGGPLYDNNDVVFTVVQPESNYWKVENKTDYTGKGWNEDPNAPLTPVENIPYGLQEYQKADATPQTTQLSLKSQAYIPYPYGNIQLTTLPDQNEMPVYFLQQSNRFILTGAKKDTTVTMAVNKISTSPDNLQAIHISADDKKRLENFLQLPSSLPERVKNLANELTDGLASPIEKVKAIEDHLESLGNYRYSKIDAQHTPENRDYVDYFLFDTKVGYCDNFSTSMVILLRAAGLPARWAKGFTGGYQTGTKNDNKIYTILNSNAHSWPEVYFPGFGWLPFEPTPAFSNPATAEQEVPETTSAPRVSDIAEQSSELADTQRSSSETTTTTENGTTDTLKNNNKFLFFALFSVLVLVVLGFYRKKLYWFTYVLCLRSFIVNERQAYRFLLWGCERLLPRAPEEDLVTYSMRFEANYPLNDRFIKLTTHYETFLYDSHATPFDKTMYHAVADAIRKQI